MIALTKTAETSSTLTLGWSPPAGVEWYLFYAAGNRVSNAAPTDKNGVPKTSIKFSKSTAPYQVVAVVRGGSTFSVEVGSYALTPSPAAAFPSTSLYPSEVNP